MLRIQLFGRPQLSLDGVPRSALGRPKVLPLLAYLLLHRGTPLPRRTIAAALWPDDADEEARANLRRHLSYLNAVLPPPSHAPWIVTSPTTVHWNTDAGAWLDVERFEELAANPARLAEACALYAGPLLADVDEEWLEPERERLAAVYRHAATALVAQLRAARDYVPAIAAAERLLAADPWHEDVLRSLVTLRYESGDRAGALAEFERFESTLRDELGTDPMPETRAVYEAIARDAAPPGAPSDPSPRGARTGRAMRSLPFVGRDAEIAALRERFDAAASGRGGVVLVGGEAGIGKTRLVREFAVQCEARGAQCYAAVTTFPETAPYQPFRALLRVIAPLAAAAPVDPLWLSALATLEPSIGEGVASLPALPPLESDRERLRLFEACTNLWTAIGTRRPVVLVVEDVQWAGPATLALLEHLGRGATHGRLLVVATYRDDDVGLTHPLRALRRRIEREASGAHVAPSRLSRAEVEVLLASLGYDPGLAARLHERSEGNALFLEELLRDYGETGRLHGDDADPAGAGEPVPPAIRSVLAARIGRLSEPAKAIAGVAAVIGRSFDIELLRETTGWLEAPVLDALGELMDRRIVGERGSFDYAFTHHSIQSLVYDDAPAAARARRHRRVAHVMESLYAARAGDLAAELALHWERGGDAGRAAHHYLIAARRAFAVYGREEAAHDLDRVLALTVSPRERFEALLLRERIASLLGERELQSRIVAELAALAATLDDDSACMVLDRRIALADTTGDRRLQRTLLRLLHRRVARCGDPAHCVAWLEAEARYCRSTSNFPAARAAFAELIELAGSSGDHGTLATARIALADSYLYEGRLDEAYPVLVALRDAVQTGGDHGALVRTLMSFARAALVVQDYAKMSQFAHEAHELSRSIGDREGEALALHTLANGLVYTFRVAEAESYYLRALELYERIGHRVGLAGIFVDLGLFHTELGLLDQALTLYARAREIANDLQFRFVACVERVNAAYCLRLRGEPAAAKACAEEAIALARDIGSAHLESAGLGTLGAAETALGEYTAAIAHLTRGVEMRRPAGATPRLGDNLCALALACTRAGDGDAARSAAAELMALYESNPKLAPQPTEWLWTAAQVAFSDGRDDEARALLRHAASVMQARAAAIDDPVTRAAYLALPFNRAVADDRSGVNAG